MAKAKTARATARTARTVKVGNTTVKGATEADRAQIAAARAANRAEEARAATAEAPREARANTKTAAATPEAQDTPRARREAAQKLFDKADEEGRAAIIAETTARNAALGF
jgi:hypothetical protein